MGLRQRTNAIRAHSNTCSHYAFYPEHCFLGYVVSELSGTLCLLAPFRTTYPIGLCEKGGGRPEAPVRVATYSFEISTGR